MRKNEFSALKFNVAGRFIHPNGKEVRRFHPVANVKQILEVEFSKTQNFQKSLMDLGPSSEKYQKVGIHSTKKTSTGGFDFYHFEVGFVYKEQEQLETYDMKSHKFEEITIDGTRYRHVRLHFTVVPDEGLIVLDNKCHSSATKVILSKVVEPHLTPANYGLASSDPTGILRVNIVPVPQDDFEEKLNAQFRNLKEVSMYFAKPSKLKMSALPEDLDKEDEFDKFKDVSESIFKAVFGLSMDEETFDTLPVKGVRISVQIDDQVGTVTKRNQIKTSAKTFLKDYRENLYTDNASFKYSDAGEVEQALMNSAKLTAPVTVNANHYGDAEKMWKEQRSSFTDLRRKGKL